MTTSVAIGSLGAGVLSKHLGVELLLWRSVAKECAKYRCRETAVIGGLCQEHFDEHEKRRVRDETARRSIRGVSTVSTCPKATCAPSSGVCATGGITSALP
jgi:hypothetical protein